MKHYEFVQFKKPDLIFCFQVTDGYPVTTNDTLQERKQVNSYFLKILSQSTMYSIIWVMFQKYCYWFFVTVCWKTSFGLIVKAHRFKLM